MPFKNTPSKNVKEKIPPTQKTINKYCFATFNFFSSILSLQKQKEFLTQMQRLSYNFIIYLPPISYMIERILSIIIIFLLSLKIFAHI